MIETQIGMFDTPWLPTKPPARPKLIEITGMEWEQDKDGDWIAQGKRGRFALWKEGRKWRGRYISRPATYWFDLPRGLSLEQLKEMCEKNRYWEKA